MISSSRTVSRRISAALVAVAALTLAAPVSPSSSAEPSPPGTAQPNIVVIMVDDMRADEMAWMPRTQELLGQFELTDFVSNHPLCCPARAELMTGQFGHHNGVHHNEESGSLRGGYQALYEKDNTIASWFDDAGYTTSLAGKFINGWSEEWGKPAGWDRFSVLTRGTYTAYDFDVWRDGVIQTYDQGLHNNDFVTSESVTQIGLAAASDEPFFHHAAYTVPHAYRETEGGRWLGGPVPADRHKDLFSDVQPPSVSAPSFDPPPGMRIRHMFRERIRSLQSVDEGVQAIVDATRTNGTYDNTVFVFTSDNGYLLGEHGLKGKNVPYEEALRVPLLAAGPGVPTGTSDKGSMITDIAPSLSELAGVDPARPQDGRDDLFSLHGGWSQVLIQAGSSDPSIPWWWRGVRERKWVYVRFVDRAPQLFNLERDPYQLDDLHGDRPATERRLRSALPEVENHLRTTPQRAPMARMTEPNG